MFSVLESIFFSNQLFSAQVSQRPFRACAKLSVFGKKARNRHFESAILFCFGKYVKLTPIHSRSPGPIPSFSPATRQPSSKKFLLYFYPLVVVLYPVHFVVIFVLKLYYSHWKESRFRSVHSSIITIIRFPFISIKKSSKPHI